MFKSDRDVDDAMRYRRATIPISEQCENCKGGGNVRVGCAITRAIYATCWVCHGSGQRDKGESESVNTQQQWRVCAQGAGIAAFYDYLDPRPAQHSTAWPYTPAEITNALLECIDTALDVASRLERTKP